MALDFVKLSVGMDTTGLQEGEVALNKLTKTGAKTELSVNKTGAAITKTGDAAKRSAGGLKAAGASAVAYGQNARFAGGQTANLAAQFNDVGQMLMAGQSPLLLAAQQGTLISQVLNQMGSGRQILQGLAGAFMSVVNPVSLLTLGVIAGGAALVQWGMKAFSAGEDAKTLEEHLGELEKSVGAYISAMEAAAVSTETLAAKFGDANEEVRKALEFVADSEREKAIRSLDSSLVALTETFGGLSRTQLVSTRGGIVKEIEDTFFNLREEFDLTDRQAARLVTGLEALALAEGAEAQAAAAVQLNERFLEVFGTVGNIPEPLFEIFDATAQASLQAAELGANIKDAEGATNAHAASARILLAELVAQGEMQQLITQYGEDSLEVTTARVQAERDAFEETLATRDIAEELADELLAAWDNANGVASVDMAGNITLAANEAARLAHNLALAARGDAMLRAARDNPDFYDPRNESGLAGVTDPNVFDVPLGLPGVVMPPNPKVGGGGGRRRGGGGRRRGGGGSGQSEAQREHNEMLREAERLFDSTRTEAEKYGIELDRLNELHAAGVIDNEVYGRALEDLEQKYLGAGDAAAFFEEQQRKLEDAIIDTILEGGSLAEVFADLAKEIAKAALQAALFGRGPLNNTGGMKPGGGILSGLMGSLFGGGGLGGLFSFDGGGDTPDGSRTGGLDGKGGFIAMLHPNETVTDNTKAGQSAAPQVSVNPIIVYDMREVGNYLMGPEGERVFVDVARRAGFVQA